jgi:uncharacterized protein (TIGR00251 family)
MAEIIEVHVKPGSGKSEITGTDEKGVLKVSLKARAEDGKANIELIKLLTKHFGRPAKIKSGHTQKRKLIVLD